MSILGVLPWRPREPKRPRRYAEIDDVRRLARTWGARLVEPPAPRAPQPPPTFGRKR